MTSQYTQGGTVWFIGAGPGDPDLITVKGRKIIEAADLVLYAGSLVPRELVACAKSGATVMDSAPMNLDETHAAMRDVAKAGGLVARVHTGDPMLYGAFREQAALLDRDGIPYAIVPGVSAAFATAAAARLSLTVPEKVQSFAITRLDGRTPVPEGQRVADYARHKGALAVYLSADAPEVLEEELRSGGLPDSTVVVLAYRVGWPDERVVRTTLKELAVTARKEKFSRQTIFLVLPGEDGEASAPSKLYDATFSHGFRE